MVIVASIYRYNQANEGLQQAEYVQRQDFIPQTIPAHQQRTHAAKHTQCTLAAKKASKWYNRVVLLNNNISKICVPSVLSNCRFVYHHTAKSNKISHHKLEKLSFKPRKQNLLKEYNHFVKRVRNMTKQMPERNS